MLLGLVVGVALGLPAVTLCLAGLQVCRMKSSYDVPQLSSMQCVCSVGSARGASDILNARRAIRGSPPFNHKGDGLGFEASQTSHLDRKIAYPESSLF